MVSSFLSCCVLFLRLYRWNFYAGQCYSHGSFNTKVGKLIKQDRINFVKKPVTTITEGFCPNIADDNINHHMEKYKDIICIVPEAKNLDEIIEIKDIEKVANKIRWFCKL